MKYYPQMAPITPITEGQEVMKIHKTNISLVRGTWQFHVQAFSFFEFKNIPA